MIWWVVFVLVLLLIWLVLVLFIFPIINGYAAKNLASGIFVQKRELKEFVADEFNRFPFNITSQSVDTLSLIHI